MSLIHKILNLIFPTQCLGCGRPGFDLCPNCALNLPPADTTDLAETYACFDYETQIVKKLIWRLKYRGHSALAKPLAPLLYELILPEIADGRLFDTRPWLIVPTPLRPKRLAERGFNQAALLAKFLAAKDPANLKYQGEILEKIKDTSTQVSLKNRATRLKNLHQAFAVCRPELVKGQKIIVVDDVITTGATVGEARRALLKAGAKRVLALALAHG